MPMVWITSLHNLHCPSCDARLIEQAGRFEPMGRPDPIYQADPRTLTCPNGHRLPEDQDELYTYRDEKGHPPEEPPTEVAPPR